MTGLGASALRDDVTLVRSCNEVGLCWASAAAALAIAARIGYRARKSGQTNAIQRRNERVYIVEKSADALNVPHG